MNPLVLIQLPDRKTSLEDEIKYKVIQILKDKHKITRDNGKLAIHLSEDKENLENIAKNDNEVEVLIFKQALALGWDCPRAQILVLFREWHSPIFSIQTVGRIMRMPEIKHYENYPNLNYGYVFTNLAGIEIQEDIARDYITTNTSHRKSDYKSADLLSCYRERHREMTRLAPLFIEMFLEVAKKQNLKKLIDTSAKKVSDKVISDWSIENVDLGTKGLIGEGKAKYDLSSWDLQRLFEFFVRQNLSPFYPEERSIGRVKEAMYRFFEVAFLMEYVDKQDEIIQIVLSDKNMQRVLDVLGESKDIYKQEVSKREEKLATVEKWNIPEQLAFNSNYVKEQRERSIMQPFFNYPKSELEKKFVAVLDKSDKVKWWFKNGDRDATFFAVPYEENAKPSLFYVDFIVMLKDEKIGLFDTKAGWTQKVAGPKVDGLYKYIQQGNKKGKKLFGGVVTITSGRWIYFDKEAKDLKDGDFNNWTNLNF